MKLSSKAHHGLRACIILAKNYPSSVSASGIEKEIGVSGKYLERLLRTLSGTGIIGTIRGASGGYFLKKEPKDITVGEIVRPLEDDLKVIGCANGCTCNVCASSKVWQKLYEGINNVLDSMNLQEIL